MNLRNLNYEKVLANINQELEQYFKDNNIKTVVIGISGGLDSALNTIILKPICDKLGIKIVGRYIHIESNKHAEKERADLIGKNFTHEYKSVDLTDLYFNSLPVYEENFDYVKTNISFSDKIRRGNIKARMRMIYLFNLSSQYTNGLVIDNDNMTEHLLGFWTLNGDVGTLTPLASLFKTEVFGLARYIKDYVLTTISEKNALNNVIYAVPTDGLGITSSDVEQFGVKSYDEVDEILMSELNFIVNHDISKYSSETIDKIMNRHKNSNFKRHCPYKINCFKN